MIDHILTVLGPAPIAVQSDFNGKDVELAERLLQQVDNEQTREHDDKLTEAVAAALPDSELFFKCLMRRARQAYATGRFQSCARDCRLYLDRRASIMRGDESDHAVDVLFLLSDACKGMRKDVEARNHVNEAMKLISRFAAASCGTDRADSQRFKDEKAALFKRFLSRRQKPAVASSARLGNSQRTSSLLAYRTVITAALSSVNGDDDLSSTRGINRYFLKLHEDEDATPIDAVAPDPEKYKPDDYKTVFALKTHGGDFVPEDNFERAAQSIFLARCFIDALSLSAEEAEKSSTDKDLLRTLAVATLHSMHAINCNAYEIVENVRDESSKIFEPRNVGGAIYSTVSLTNHSCYPNVVRHSYPCGKYAW
ncbi:unnamed protein product [Trichogramma brassicae]|uniref:SET domain-containing protein n=1 Tax=Trichogramma brassicae TaxID=86971 RepID=A0A6H5IF84_9HYME|nr:unnamed protein product [Trichogramma brassicae]